MRSARSDAFGTRLTELRRKLSAARLDALLITFLPHVRYLTGFSGSNGMCLVTHDDQCLVTDSRYQTQVTHEVKGFRILVTRRSLFEEAARKRALQGLTNVGFESQHVSVAGLENLKKVFPRIKLVPTHSLVESIASIKDDSEIELITQAVRITDTVFDTILDRVKPGVSERDLAAEIGYWHKRHGAEADAFEPSVASGERGTLPHARASEKKIKKGELVTLDLGCRYKGYHSDLTRTIAVGKPSAQAKRIYTLVLDALRRAIDAAENGLKAKALDGVARRYIRSKGYGKYFSHSLGHGLGLQVHEAPRLSSMSKDVLKSGNVVTIEPGIYVPGVCGVRIEDDVVIRNGHCEILTTSPKEMIVL